MSIGYYEMQMIAGHWIFLELQYRMKDIGIYDGDKGKAFVMEIMGSIPSTE